MLTWTSQGPPHGKELSPDFSCEKVSGPSRAQSCLETPAPGTAGAQETPALSHPPRPGLSLPLAGYREEKAEAGNQLAIGMLVFKLSPDVDSEQQVVREDPSLPSSSWGSGFNCIGLWV